MEGSVAAARFQMVAMARHHEVPASRRPQQKSMPATDGRLSTVPVSKVFTWWFLAANNRRLARAATTFSHAQACLEAIRKLQEGLPRAVVVMEKDSPTRWVWRVRVDGADQAMSHHGHPRRVRAQSACDAFLALVAAVDTEADVQVMYQ